MLKYYKCQHCSNQLVNHKLDKIQEIIDIFLIKNFLLLINNFTFFLNKTKIFHENKLFSYLNKILIHLNIIQIKENFVRQEVFNRSLILIDEAEKQGIKIRPIVKYNNKYLNYFHVNINHQDYFFEGLPVDLCGKNINFEIIDDKYKLKKFLLKHKFPVPLGSLFISPKAGLRYGCKLGFPLVVKPRDGSLSKHVSININNKSELIRAIDIVKKYKNFYIVEEYIPGDVFRISIINDNIFAALRKPAVVIGDGKNTIKQLVDKKNNNSLRGEIGQKNKTIHKIDIDKSTLELLEKQNYTINTILKKDEQAKLKEKVNLNSGCDIIDVTNNLNQKNKELFQWLARLLNTDILGIDFICEDISIPWQLQKSSIIECNSLPYLDMHHYPTKGSPQNVAREMINLFKKTEEEKRG